ncbi:MAG: esterase-like activity of phytase family protein [Solimonas sp.]
MTKNLVAAVLAASFLVACSDDDDNNAPLRSGVLVDSAVAGVAYDSGSESGVTDAAGTFQYREGETVTFKVGGMTVGAGKGKAQLLLRELDGGSDANALPNQSSINRAVLLQTLDSDSDPTNGITISTATATALKNAAMPDVTKPSADFATALATVLSAASITRTVQDAGVARDHLLVGEAQLRGSVTEPVSGGVFTSIQHFVVPDNRVPYTGTDAGIKAAYPNGFPLAVGSGLNYIATSGGAMTFYSITDRGPNGDSPALTDGTLTKVFPVPAYAPTFVKLTVASTGVTISDVHELKVSDTTKVTGLPLPKGTVGSTSETALSEALLKLDPATDVNGLDTEAIVRDPDSVHAWTCDEYGPFVSKFELATGKIVRTYKPGTELPAIIAQRQPNRGCEGLALTPSGKLYQMVQSTLDIKKNTALFTRIVEIDKTTNEATPPTRMLAYPLTPADWEDGKSGKAKLGDMVAIDNTHFLIIEQGAFADHKIHNKLFLVDISQATDITNVKTSDDKELENITTPADLAARGVVTATKTLIADFRDYGWQIEKAEGLALIDSQTIALINDDDFGVAVEARTAAGVLAADVTALKVDDTGKATDAEGTVYTYKIVPNKPQERHTQLWVFKLAKPVLQFQAAAP